MTPQQRKEQLEEMLDSETWCGCYEGDLRGDYDNAKDSVVSQIEKLIESAVAEELRNVEYELMQHGWFNKDGLSLDLYDTRTPHPAMIVRKMIAKLQGGKDELIR